MKIKLELIIVFALVGFVVVSCNDEKKMNANSKGPDCKSARCGCKKLQICLPRSLPLFLSAIY